MSQYQDQTGALIDLPNIPRRIVSLVPSQTELLFDLGLKDQLVGITRFCIYPKHLRQEIPTVGGTKLVNIEKIEKLKPDLIIANKEENSLEDIKALKQRFPVWISDIITIKDALDMINQIGIITLQHEKSIDLVNKIKKGFKNWKSTNSLKNQNALYLIWKDPLMAVGNKTFIHSMMKLFGLSNVLESVNRYPEVTTEIIERLQPNHVMLSSEPYPFKEKHVEEIQHLFPHSRLHIVDATYFSWYGSRMLHAPQYFHKLMPLFK